MVDIPPPSPLFDITKFDDPLYLLIIPYAVGQPLFRAYLQKRYDLYAQHKFVCKAVMALYNIVLAAFSLSTAVAMIYALVSEIPGGIYGPGHYESETYARISWWFYISKYVEFLDTYFLILCHRPVIWLQYLHHMGAPLDLGVWHNNRVEGTWIYVVFNGLIHTVMYAYYAACILKLPFPYKRYITNLQILQFVSGLTVVAPYAFQPWYWEDDGRRTAWLFNYGYVLMNLVMFLNFYRQTYLKKKAGKVLGVRRGVAGAARVVAQQQSDIDINTSFALPLTVVCTYAVSCGPWDFPVIIL